MSTADRIHPVTRFRVLVGALILVGALTAVVGLSEALRHPAADVPVDVAPDQGDVRDDVICPGPLAREAEQERPPAPVTSGELYDCPASYDGQLVRYEGEVVGALMSRRNGAWTQLNDDHYAGDLGPLPTHRNYRGANSGVGVFLPPELTDQVRTVGGPNARGDVLAVVGTFHRVDPESQEVAVIRADSATVARPGEPLDHPPLHARRVIGVLLALAAAGVTAAERITAPR